MAIRTQQPISGFIHSEPLLTRPRRGEARSCARAGQRHPESLADGSYTRLDVTHHDLVVYRTAAEYAYEMLRQGASFIAEGHVGTYEHIVDGQTAEREKFVATMLGYDVACYTHPAEHATPGVDRDNPSTPDYHRPVQRQSTTPASVSAPPVGISPTGLPSELAS